MDIQQIKFIISNTSPFNKLSESEIDEFLSISEVREYRVGEILYKDKDPADYFYFILHGRVIALTHDGQNEKEIELLKRGTSFGIISLFNEEPHSVTTRSIETSSILKTPKEKFKDFLHRHPVISLEFYRLLSQRIRSRASRPKRIFQCKRISVFGLKGSGKTAYLTRLALYLKEQTKKKVICIELSSNGIFSLPSLTDKTTKILNLKDFKEDEVANYIISNCIDVSLLAGSDNLQQTEGVDCLLVALKSSENFLSLLNFLSENYHFILYEIPCEFLSNPPDEFFNPADYLHFIISVESQALSQITQLVEKFREKSNFNPDRIKIILNEANKKEDLSFAEIRKIVNLPIYATFPSCDSQKHCKALRRIARQVGDMVTGLALGSGAAYGFAHIGVIKVLEKNNINVDIACGSSIGAVIATFWALGYKAEEIEKLMIGVGKKINFFSFSGFSFPFKGFLKAKYLENIFKKLLKDKTFYDLKHNLKIVVFDFAKRETTVLTEGFLYKAVAASCAMPGVFEPIRVKNEMLLDGGILSPLPTKILLNYNVNKIIAVNVTPTREEIYSQYQHHKKWHILDFIFGSIETMQREFVQQATAVSDVVIHPNFKGIGWFEFDRVGELIKRGQEAALEKIEEIKKLL
jgi:NTE family protein